MPEEIISDTICENCKTAVKPYHRYCFKCGNYLEEDALTINIFNNLNLRLAFFFYGIYLLICMGVKYSSWFKSYDQLFWVEAVLGIITVWFALLSSKALKPVLKFNNFSWQRLLIVVSLAVIGSCFISYCITELNINYFHEQVSYYHAFSHYSFPIIVMLYSVVVVPAIFEELAFRGILYNYFSTFLDEKMVVTVTAFLFAIIHLTLVSLIWLVPFGLFIGHLRKRYNTLWYSVIFHSTFNLTACLFDLYREGILVF